MVAGPPVTEFVGLTLAVRLVELPKVVMPWHDTPTTTGGPVAAVGQATCALPLVNVSPTGMLARVVPFATFVKVTVAPETKPAPVTVTVVAAAGATRSTRPAGLTEAYEGSALTTMAPATVTVPPSSVSVML
jgi:hypothetical protein